MNKQDKTDTADPDREFLHTLLPNMKTVNAKQRLFFLNNCNTDHRDIRQFRKLWTIIHWVGGNIHCLFCNLCAEFSSSRAGYVSVIFTLLGIRINNDSNNGNGHTYLISMRDRHCNSRGMTV
jgi:hypothetical protein